MAAKKSYTESSLGGYVTSSKGLIGKNQEIDENGLFSERLFGPTQSYKCRCGNLKTKVLDANKVCPKCGVFCGPNNLRLSTFCKIKLVFPIIKPIRKKLFSKIVGKQNKSLIEPQFADASKSETRYLAVQKNGQKIFIVNKLNANSNCYTIPFRITGIYSLILILRYVADHLNVALAKEYFENGSIIDELSVLPADLRMAKIDPEKQQIRSPRINDYYTSVLNLNKSHGSLLSNLRSDEHLWMEQITVNIKNGLWDEEIVDASCMEMDGITARYQYYINLVYQEVYEQLSGKPGLIRSSILGRTIEFSARSVIRVDPSLDPYEIKVSKKILWKLWSPYFLNYLTQVRGMDYDACFENVVNKKYEDHQKTFNEFLDWFMIEHCDE